MASPDVLAMPQALRTIAAAYAFDMRLSVNDIATRLDVERDTITQLLTYIMTNADSTNLPDVLTVLESLDDHSQPVDEDYTCKREDQDEMPGIETREHTAPLDEVIVLDDSEDEANTVKLETQSSFEADPETQTQAEQQSEPHQPSASPSTTPGREPRERRFSFQQPFDDEAQPSEGTQEDPETWTGHINSVGTTPEAVALKRAVEDTELLQDGPSKHPRTCGCDCTRHSDGVLRNKGGRPRGSKDKNPSGRRNGRIPPNKGSGKYANQLHPPPGISQEDYDNRSESDRRALHSAADKMFHRFGEHDKCLDCTNRGEPCTMRGYDEGSDRIITGSMCARCTARKVKCVWRSDQERPLTIKNYHAQSASVPLIPRPKGRPPGSKDKAPRRSVPSPRFGTGKFARQPDPPPGYTREYYDSCSSSKKEALHRAESLKFHTLDEGDKCVSCANSNEDCTMGGYDEGSDRVLTGSKCSRCTARMAPCMWIPGRLKPPLTIKDFHLQTTHLP